MFVVGVLSQSGDVLTTLRAKGVTTRALMTVRHIIIDSVSQPFVTLAFDVRFAEV